MTEETQSRVGIVVLAVGWGAWLGLMRLTVWGNDDPAANVSAKKYPPYWVRPIGQPLTISCRSRKVASIRTRILNWLIICAIRCGIGAKHRYS